MILEIAIRVNDLRSALAVIIMNGEYFCDNSRDDTKQLSLSSSREASRDERDSGNGTSCSSGSGNEVAVVHTVYYLSKSFGLRGQAVTAVDLRRGLTRQDQDQEGQGKCHFLICHYFMECCLQSGQYCRSDSREDNSDSLETAN